MLCARRIARLKLFDYGHRLLCLEDCYVGFGWLSSIRFAVLGELLGRCAWWMIQVTLLGSTLGRCAWWGAIG